MFLFLGSMDLSFNELSGGLPSELGNISLLRSLNMNSNQLSGQVPSEIAKLSRLSKNTLVTMDKSQVLASKLTTLFLLFLIHRHVADGTQ